MDSNTEIIFETPDCRLYKDGRVERLSGNDVVSAGFDATTSVTSKDVVIDTETGVFVRIYLPDMSTLQSRNNKRLPIVIYFHGGGFVMSSAATPMYHNYLNSVTSKASAIVVSVDYRLAPEHPLPAAYDDSWAALNWAVSGTDPWLAEHGDIARVFLAGDSAGGNIVHNIAMKAGITGLAPQAQIEGAILLHAGFSGKEPVEGEAMEMWEMMAKLWSVLCTDAKDGLDDPRINPVAAEAPSLEKLACKRLLVCVAEKDLSRPRGKWYYEAVQASTWCGDIDWFESEGEDHVFFILKTDPGHEAVKLMDRLVSFLAGN